ncbi:intracellular septation protein A [Inhella inkyongensis]|uniref:Intracellular septation protein A n=1 Tax=Inhella inkyongensis TaxID=392593 RepID=A0A840RYG9_9BURK|nr:hypothetical protein [Inhella inkyongensis]MBB5203005.1 intracellular septation protein A [Inhella inkyongensis]
MSNANVATMRFKTLLQREWMQHRWGWLAVMALPLVIALLSMPFGGNWQFGPDDELKEVGSVLNLALSSKLAAAVWGFSTMAVLSLTLLAMMLQVSGLARRDAQDRSLEFWTSLPGSHSEHIGATLLAHCLLVPLAAIGVGVASGLVIAACAVVKVWGFGALAQVQWITVAGLLLPGLVRLVVGLSLFMLWLSPLVLLLMAASAWLKRLGVPAVVVAGVVLGNLPATRDFVRPWLKAHAEGMSQAFFVSHPQQWMAAGGDGKGIRGMDLGQIWQIVGADIGNQLQALASAQFVSGLLIAGLCFAALVYKRKHMI